MSCCVNLPQDRFHGHSSGQIWQRSLQLFMQDWRVFCKLAAIFAVPLAMLPVLWELVDIYMVKAPGCTGAYDCSRPEFKKHEKRYEKYEIALPFVAVGFYLIMAVVAAIVKVAMIRATVYSFLGIADGKTKVHLFHGLKCLPRVVGLALLFLFLCFISLAVLRNLGALSGVIFFLGLCGAVNLIPCILFCIPTIAVEDVSIPESFVRRDELSRGTNHCAIYTVSLCLVVVLFLVKGAKLLFLTHLSLLLHMIGVENFLFDYVIPYTLTQCLTVTFNVIVTVIPVVVLYLSIRIEEESLNVQSLTNEIHPVAEINGDNHDPTYEDDDGDDHDPAYEEDDGGSNITITTDSFVTKKVTVGSKPNYNLVAREESGVELV